MRHLFIIMLTTLHKTLIVFSLTPGALQVCQIHFPLLSNQKSHSAWEWLEFGLTSVTLRTQDWIKLLYHNTAPQKGCPPKMWTLLERGDYC